MKPELISEIVDLCMWSETLADCNFFDVVALYIGGGDLDRRIPE